MVAIFTDAPKHIDKLDNILTTLVLMRLSNDLAQNTNIFRASRIQRPVIFRHGSSDNYTITM